MKETYLSRDFRETAAQCFPSQAKELNAFFDARLNVLLAENADASKEKQYHLKRQILPGIAAYETLQRVMPKEEALQTVHGYVEEPARTRHKQLAALLHIPGLYRLVPGVFAKSTRSVFGPAAGFDSKELQVGNGIWRVDMMKCPYHDTCVAYGCPELCCCFCDSDDISYTGLHPKLISHRTKTLGRGRRDIDGCRRLAAGMCSAAEDGHRNVQQSLLSVRRLRLVEACIGRRNGSAWVLPLLLHGEGTEYGY